MAADLGKFRVIFFFMFLSYIENGILRVLDEAILMRTNNIPSCYRNSKRHNYYVPDLAL